MKDIITKQHIRRRKQSSLLSRTKSSRRGAAAGRGSSDYLIGGIKQKPAHKKHRKISSLRPLPQILSPILSLFRLTGLFKARKIKDGEKETLPHDSPRGIPHFTFSSFPVIVLGLLLFFSVIALIQPAELLKGVLRDAYFLEPLEDGASQQNLASYVGLSPVTALGHGIVPENGIVPGNSIPGDEIIPLDLMETFAWKSYSVKKGDSVSRIAADHAISMDAIIASNNIANARRLREGEILRIPNMDGIPYTVIKGDSLSKISSAMDVPLEVILDANDIVSENIDPGTVLFIPGAKKRTEDLKLALGELFIYPIRGRLTSPFGWRNDPISGVRRYHAAVDLAASTGTPVKAAMDGKVSTVGFNSVYGKYIIISHNSGYQTMYAHLSITSVSQGAPVYQGTKIGEVGSTGYSTGPHLHFAVYKNGRAINPLDLLSPNP
ncbi:MAG: M23 family metallopeptidase [Treponema sp.]|jgi:murein DD-endopeptidase MepM/ murein hydrolase activator NlpD|nr:M23 family metallopeptidase [Treponema sp.]